MNFSNMNLYCHHSEAVQASGIGDNLWQSAQQFKNAYGTEALLHVACTSHLLLSFDALQLFYQMRYVMTISH